MKKSLKESIKSITLIVLLAAMLLLVYLLWPEYASNFTIKELFKFGETESERVLATEELISPSSGIYKKGKTEKWLSDSKSIFIKANEGIKAVCADGESLITEITAETYNGASNDYESIRLSFDYDISFDEFCDAGGISRGVNFDLIESFSEILLSSAKRNGIFFKDDNSGSCYWLGASQQTGNVISIDAIIENESFEKYRSLKISDLMGGSNEAQVPFGDPFALSDVRLIRHSYSTDEEENITRLIFGDTLDFARRSVDAAGTITYMYGYGQKVLSIYQNGNIEYRSEVSNKQSEGVLSDLSEAVSFMEKMEQTQSLVNKFELIGIDTVEEGNYTSRIFSFVQILNGKKLLAEEGAAVEIEIRNSSVVYYQKRAVDANADELAGSGTGKQPAVIAAENCEEIYLLDHETAAEDTETAFDYAAENIRRIYPAYYKNTARNVLSPCYIIRLNSGKEAAFDYYSGEPLRIK